MSYEFEKSGNANGIAQLKKEANEKFAGDVELYTPHGCLGLYVHGCGH
ncbi:hypothetical protein [Klebsiella pneumoniae]|nr:hypothetical protein [Klebsiella pneumoniae]MCY0155230.1 hypothetical protein [Klebsiella pneumoniae]